MAQILLKHFTWEKINKVIVRKKIKKIKIDHLTQWRKESSLLELWSKWSLVTSQGSWQGSGQWSGLSFVDCENLNFLPSSVLCLDLAWLTFLDLYFRPELISELRSLTPLSLSLCSGPGRSQGEQQSPRPPGDKEAGGGGEGGDGREGDGEGEGEGCDLVKLSTVGSLTFSGGVLSISSSLLSLASSSSSSAWSSAWKIKSIFSCQTLQLPDWG